jgi:hypothetical protein
LFVDTDEFLHLEKHKNIGDFISDYAEEVCIVFPRLNYGSSFKDRVVRQKELNRHGPLDHCYNFWGKSIVHMKRIKEIQGVHTLDTDNGVDVNGNVVDGDILDVIDFGTAYIKHYATRGIEQLEDKIKRGPGNNTKETKRSPEYKDWNEYAQWLRDQDANVLNMYQEGEIDISKKKMRKGPVFLKRDLNLFDKYVGKATNYLEYGCGGSTHFVADKPNIKSVFSIESDIAYLSKVKSHLQSDKVTLIGKDLFCRKEFKRWGFPGPNCPNENKFAYQDAGVDILKSHDIDTILIDGRFRAVCALKWWHHMKDDAVIIFDDFLDRLELYHIVKEHFLIIDSTEDKSMVVLSKQKSKPPSPEDIKKMHLCEW